MVDFAPYDPNDPLNQVADGIRKKIAKIALEAMDSDAYRSLPPKKQLQAIMAGIATAYVGVSFSHIQPDGRDALFSEMVEYLPQARLNAEAMIESGRNHG